MDIAEEWTKQITKVRWNDQISVDVEKLEVQNWIEPVKFRGNCIWLVKTFVNIYSE